jgi:hypothetical protein
LREETVKEIVFHTADDDPEKVQLVISERTRAWTLGHGSAPRKAPPYLIPHRSAIDGISFPFTSPKQFIL